MKKFLIIALLLTTTFSLAQDTLVNKYPEMEKYLMKSQGNYTKYSELCEVYLAIYPYSSHNSLTVKGRAREYFLDHLEDVLALKGYKIIENKKKTGVAIVKDCK